MAHTVPTTEPAQVRAGDLATWKISLADYSAADGWALSYALVKSGTRITFNASASGADFLVAVSAATTAPWVAGTYQFVARVTKGTEIYTVREGSIDILPDLASASSGYDARSHARKTLDALEAWIEGRDMGVAEYEINVGGGSRRLKTIPITELLRLRDLYRREVRGEEDAQRAAAGLPKRNRILVRFGGS